MGLVSYLRMFLWYLQFRGNHYICPVKDKDCARKKDIKIELSSLLEQMKKSEELHKKREEEHLATIAAMQRRIDDLEGINNSMKSWCSVDEQEKVKFYTCDDIGQCPTGILYPLQ